MIRMLPLSSLAPIAFGEGREFQLVAYKQFFPRRLTVPSSVAPYYTITSVRFDGDEQLASPAPAAIFALGESFEAAKGKPQTRAITIVVFAVRPVPPRWRWSWRGAVVFFRERLRPSRRRIYAAKSPPFFCCAFSGPVLP